MANTNNNALTEGTQSEAQNNNNSKTAKNKSGSTTPRKVDPLWSVIRKANKVFAVQIKKDNECKLNCLEFAMHSKFDDHEKFWVEYHKHTSTLLDSRRFCKDCMDRGYCPVAIAEHVVFEGSTVMRKVLKEGVFHAIGENIQFYTKGFTPQTKAVYITQAGDILEKPIKKMATASTADDSKSADTKEKVPEQAPKAEEQQTPEQTPEAA